ncbi:MAG: hypothetical protein ACR2PY_03270 [Salinispira sp.]
MKHFILAFTIAVLKSCIYFVYFAFFFDGIYTLTDDWKYLSTAIRFWENAPLGIVGLKELIEQVKIITNSSHPFYPIVNIFAVRLFGMVYSAPVAINYIILPVIACIGANFAARELLFDNTQKRLIYILLLFYPFLNSWATILNLKDIWVLILFMGLLIGYIHFFHRRYVQAFLLIIPISLVFGILRYYVPYLFFAAFILTLMLHKKTRKMAVLLSTAGIVGLLLFFPSFTNNILLFVNEAQTIRSFPIGFLRFSVTPIPFNTTLHYSFLNIPSIIHWLLFPFMLAGITQFWKTGKMPLRFLVIVVFVFTCFYASFSLLQGPRHRIQLSYNILLFQFVSFYPFISKIIAGKHIVLMKRSNDHYSAT